MNVYISHSDADKKLAEDLRTALAEQDIKVWNPASQIVPGDNWNLKSGKALQNADAVVVLVSPNSVKSDWVRHEIDYALSSPQFRDRLVSVIVEPTAEMPWILRKQQVIRATKNTQQIAQRIADALRKPKAAVAK